MAARVVLSLDDAIVKEVKLAKPVTVIGRHPGCDIVVEDAAISGRHMLLRLVNRTVYAEDLASTNGMKVNGIPASHQVVHHLDMIEIGRHKIHFFDDSLLTGALGDLEHTVLTEYERTMLAPSYGEAALAPPAEPDRDELELTRTLALPADPAVHLGPSHGHVETEEVGVATQAIHSPHAAAHAPPTLALRALNGRHGGELVSLHKANTMIGEAGGESALIVRRGEGFFLVRFSGKRAPRLNREELGPGTHPIALHDVVEVGPYRYEVVPAH